MNSVGSGGQVPRVCGVCVQGELNIPAPLYRNMTSEATKNTCKNSALHTNSVTGTDLRTPGDILAGRSEYVISSTSSI